MTREIITLRGKSRDEKIALARRIKTELETELPELAALREELIGMGMMAPGLSAVRAIKTENIDYDVRRDDPDHDANNWAKEPIITEEIIRAREQLQARKIREARAAQQLPVGRGSHRRR